MSSIQIRIVYVDKPSVLKEIDRPATEDFIIKTIQEVHAANDTATGVYVYANNKAARFFRFLGDQVIIEDVRDEHAATSEKFMSLVEYNEESK